MISVRKALLYHADVVKESGGANGLRDEGTLESALQRPFQTFGGEDLYLTIFEKVAALMESLIVNHPFVDGNKRTGYVLGRILLLENGFDITADENMRYDFVIAIASGEMHYDEILAWLKQNTLKI